MQRYEQIGRQENNGAPEKVNQQPDIDVVKFLFLIEQVVQVKSGVHDKRQRSDKNFQQVETVQQTAVNDVLYDQYPQTDKQSVDDGFLLEIFLEQGMVEKTQDQELDQEIKMR